MDAPLIINRQKERGETRDIINPFNEEKVGTIVQASEDQVNMAVGSADHAFRSFRDVKTEDRRQILLAMSEWVHKNRGRLAKLMARESGKPITHCDSEVHGAAERLNVAASEVFFMKGETVKTKGTKATVFRKPLGVISAIGPFNYPFFTLISKVAPAIASGNTVVAKPASDDPLVFMDFAEAVQEMLPAGVLNAITGSGSVAGAAMVTNPATRMIAFTGSYETGKWISHNAGLKKLQLELGGKAPAIVLPDADLEKAAKEIVKGSLNLSGQRCDAISLVVVHSDVKADLTDLIVKEASKWSVGNPLHDSTDLGPLVNYQAVEKVKELVDDALHHGARPLTEYKVEKRMFHPLVLDDVNEKMRISREETFGPVIPLMEFQDLDWLLDHFNGLPYRLDSAVFGENVRQLFKIAYDLDEGSIHMNGAPFHSLGVFPYGEAPGAGMGREGLIQTMNEMTTLKTVVWRA